MRKDTAAAAVCARILLLLLLCAGGSLTEQVACLWESALQRKGLFMSEQETRYHMRQFLRAIAYCHEHRVAHRDLKLDNTLLELCPGCPPRLKLCDFGFAKRWSASGSGQMKEAIGTPVYMAPQVQCFRLLVNSL
jgi:serine/threonine-protein kinase SRK2